MQQKSETAWRKDSDWKARYSRLYSSRRISMPQEEEPRRISFMSNDSNQYLAPAVSSRRDSMFLSRHPSDYSHTILSHRSDPYSSRGTIQSADLGGHDTKLLDMVRAQSREVEEAQDKSLELPMKDESSDDQSVDACVHGLSMRYTERSVSRSRFSRVSTKRDMDIPSILAFTTSTTAPTQLEIPGFRKLKTLPEEEILRWSIRRSVCPVCSQKWRDRSAINNIKYSGLKRNSSADLPTVIAPARLRTAITMKYEPRRTLAVVDEDVPGYRLLRNTSNSWQLTRARKFLTPKLQMPPPEDTAPPSAAEPMAAKDLDLRVSKFLNDEKFIKW